MKNTRVVISQCDETGKITPKQIITNQGRVLSIDHVEAIGMRPAMRSGALGYKYVIRVGQWSSSLYWDGSVWFLENNA